MGADIKVLISGKVSTTAVTLASGVAWNSVTTPGRYYIPLATGTDQPLSSGNWLLEVIGVGTFIKQVAKQLNSAVVLQRTLNGNTWVAWDLAYSRGTILGGVGQTNGTPTGAIIERGSNANGEYTKFADGTMICKFSAGPTVSVTNAYGVGYYGQVVWTFPATFAAAPYTGLSIQGSARVTPSAYAAATNSQVTFYALDVQGSAAVQPYACHWIAIGRWF
ncbi:pyocin knob domain-containing protein [Pseudomonas huanghezhanensis]|uniref:pyocin knob domain-containing protein n=1 Tax=Pseudomonas huanghezhanensis TaxID=3002903 RepID=UPI002285FF5C|nr:pyocin knob domain-containing protein [Pseudomonas sp. BSw22131]